MQNNKCDNYNSNNVYDSTAKNNSSNKKLKGESMNNYYVKLNDNKMY